MNRYFQVILFLFLSIISYGQTTTFAYTGQILSANGPAVNVPIKLYQRTTPVMSGFTSQTNYNGHSYYRSTGTANWTTAQQNCAAMGGHLVTMSNSAENSFVYSTWPSGWIGYYQDKTGAFYSEPNGGWRWTETPYINNQVLWYNISNVVNDTTSAPGINLTGTNMRIWNSVSYSGTGTTITDVKGNSNATMYNSPAYSSSGGKYITFNGSNNYALLNDLSSKFGTSSVISIQMWVYPTGNGVILDELSIMSTSSGWHESVFEITGGNTLNCGFWSYTSGIQKVSTSITLNTWHCIGLTYDGTTLKGYLDGANFSSLAFSRATPYVAGGGGEYFALGLADGTNMGSGAYGSFRLGDLSIHNTCLTADQMNRNYMAGSFRYGVYPYSAWNGGEPNNSGGEDYIQFVGGGLWNDLNNSNYLNYVLEFDSVVTYTAWTQVATFYTDTNGNYSVSYPTNPSIDNQLVFTAPSSPANPPNMNDGLAADSLVLSRVTKNGLSYYQYDVNGDGKFSISDSWYIIAKSIGIITSWMGSFGSPKYFTTTDYNTIKLSSSDLRSTYPGTSTFTIGPLTSGGTQNYYLLTPGYSRKVTY
jgi:Concanavalin A-like lectin/glucanases superfamily/Lectin C-type domain